MLIDAFNGIVAALIELIDGALVGGNFGIGHLAPSRQVFLCPQHAIEAVIGLDFRTDRTPGVRVLRVARCNRLGDTALRPVRAGESMVMQCEHDLRIDRQVIGNNHRLALCPLLVLRTECNAFSMMPSTTAKPIPSMQRA